MKVKLTDGKNNFTKESDTFLDEDELIDLVRAFCTIYKVDECQVFIECKGELKSGQKLGALFG